ncbi:exosortase A [Colwellia chukchiensis]|uniref:Exosortase A n=2 Tax=Colwellia chukchiensis TaxID=641665 RepID=A0A1H7T678_9GAMM|nr:exosortase A [Colwellia chukchiensis]
MQLIGVFLILLAVSLFNVPVLTTLWRHSFDDGTYSHAYLIPFITLYLFYLLQNAGKLVFRDRLSLPASLLFVLACLALFITSTAQISLGYWCALLAVLISSINMLYRFNKYIVFPSLFLIFILPVWGLLTISLQNISVKAVTYLMSFTGIPTYVEGNFVTIPAGVFEIAGGCSGLRYLIVALAISSLFNFLYIKNIRKALLFFTIAIVGALITNWLRITALILIGEYTNMESSLMEDHNTFGWYLFIPFMVLLFWWGNKIADFDLTRVQAKQTYVASSPQAMTLTLVICVLALSSTSVTRLFAPTPAENMLTSDINIAIKPQIHFYSFVQAENTASTTKLVYSFNGEDLDGKPSYYDNSLIPNDWQLVSQSEHDKDQLIHISNGAKSALILASYAINGQHYASLRAFKITRLKLALKNISQSQLHWQFIPCTRYNCQGELQKLQANIIN